MLGWIDQLSVAIARLIHGPGGIDLVQARQKIDAALAQHLGSLQPLVPQLDIGTATLLLNDPERIFGYAQLLAVQADIQDASGGDGTPSRTRALAFARGALARATDPPAAWREWVAEAERGRAP
jgi:hypothetical protein